MPKELQQKSIKSNRKNDLTSRDNKDNKVDKEENEINLNEYNSSSSENDDESDGSSEEDNVDNNRETLPQLSSKPQVKDRLNQLKKKNKPQRGVVYVGHIPHGFYEDQMKDYFSQFGDVTRLRLSRNKKTGRSKHYAFIEFASKEVAEIVVDTMDNYLIDNRLLKCQLLNDDDIHESLWIGANKKFQKIPNDRLERLKFNKEKTPEELEKSKKRYMEKLKAKQDKLNQKGYDFQVPGL